MASIIKLGQVIPDIDLVKVNENTVRFRTVVDGVEKLSQEINMAGLTFDSEGNIVFDDITDTKGIIFKNGDNGYKITIDNEDLVFSTTQGEETFRISPETEKLFGFGKELAYADRSFHATVIPVDTNISFILKDTIGNTLLPTVKQNGNTLQGNDNSYTVEPNKPVEVYCDDLSYRKFIILNEFKISSLVINKGLNLKKLECHGYNLTTLDVSGCSALQSLYCGYSNLSTLDMSGCTMLTHLNCQHNNLTTLDVSGLTVLRSLYCDNNKLTTLDVSGCSALQKLVCHKNNLTTLDVPGCSALQELHCNDNKLTTLDMSGCRTLQGLYCGVNNLTTLDVSGCVALQELYCHENNLATLTVSCFNVLQVLYCNDNKLTTLDASKNLALRNLSCKSNNLTIQAKEKIYTDLPDRTGKSQGICRVDREFGNWSIAEAKNWSVD